MLRRSGSSRYRAKTLRRWAESSGCTRALIDNREGGQDARGLFIDTVNLKSSMCLPICFEVRWPRLSPGHLPKESTETSEMVK